MRKAGIQGTQTHLTLCMMYLHKKDAPSYFLKLTLKKVQSEQVLIQRTNPQEKTVTNSLSFNAK